MPTRKKQFIAGAVCPSCSEMDSLVLYVDDQSVECVSCDYTQTSQQRDQPTQKKPQATVKTNKPNYRNAGLIDITQIKE